MYALPLSCGTIVMHASTGQVISHRLQPTHSYLITSYVRTPAASISCAIDWCDVSSHAT